MREKLPIRPKPIRKPAGETKFPGLLQQCQSQSGCFALISVDAGKVRLGDAGNSKAKDTKFFILIPLNRVAEQMHENEDCFFRVFIQVDPNLFAVELAGVRTSDGADGYF